MPVGSSPDVELARWSLHEAAPSVVAPGLSPVWAATVSPDGGAIHFAHADAAGVAVWAAARGDTPQRVVAVRSDQVPVGRAVHSADGCLVYESPVGLAELCGETVRSLGERSRPIRVGDAVWARPLSPARLSGLDYTEPVAPVEVLR